MAKDNNLGDFLTDIANAIRAKKGTSESINAQDFASEIASLEGDGGKKQRVMYLRRNNGGYIYTGVQGANSNLTIEVRCAFRTFPTGYWTLISAYVNESTNATRILYSGKNTVLASLNSLASQSASVTRVGYTNVIYTDVVTSTSDSTFTITSNGLSGTKTKQSGGDLNSEIRIFPTTADAVDIEIYQVKILDGDTLIRNYIPDYRNGEYGFWDTVTQQFYGNEGDGEFSGEIITIDG